jgi:hypothetical protein
MNKRLWDFSKPKDTSNSETFMQLLPGFGLAAEMGMSS